MSGSVKWFDPSKGYGFIVPDEELPNVLLHVTCLRHGGFQTAYGGGTRGLRSREELQRVCRPLAFAASMNLTAIRPSQLPQRTRVVVVPESGWERVVVKWFNRLRGFGFLTLGPQTPKYLCIWKHCDAAGITELRPGQRRARALRQGTKGSDRGGT